ncbi:nitrate- and nitrite sensing domain-containing protein [Streptomyces sp. S.PB5]|uniref:sensor histidine kinase n=1 Tax=Streptomyces sp. S.PB5 TaxID=3020844 RepID=UPI0025AFFDF4|nr:nitrate- and nitrite sensing domain-containing protein [Streptomyces sp. S.PB5]MDN3021646.1 nitrate- and nitrite sensing domain-containing protein [Streptomyces sp. S.PB5]
MSPRTGARRRLGSIRLSLILLALVPSVTLTALWGVTTTQMFTEGLRLRGQTELSLSTGALGTDATLALQRERSQSAAWLASPHGSRAALDAQRKETDKAVGKLVGQSEAINNAPARISDRLYSVLGSVGSLEYYRGQVDNPTDITAAQALDQYSSIIDEQIHAFQELSQVDDGDLTSQAGPLVALEHAAELVSQEDARLTLAWPTGHLTDAEWTSFAKLVHSQRWLVEDQIVPQLSGSAKIQAERILQSPEWRTLTQIEDQVLAARSEAAGGRVPLPDAEKKWTAALDTVTTAYIRLIQDQTSGLLTRSADKADSLLFTAASLSAGGLLGLLLCVGMSWRITRSLSRRLHGLREATLSLAEERLPDVVARLDRGEKVDVDLAAPPLDYGGDELGSVAMAFNKAQRTAVHTAVELADTRRGFQKVILGIARQSQNLVNLQLTKLDALERRHTDPEVLKDLYELDSTASQLRRYEENLVVVSGERPGRSWSEPVALIDILRSAVGEVAEYQRAEVHTEEDVFLAPPAVADVIHLLAELIDNATAYSPAPAPVTVHAALVAKGLAVEVEDRGLGMSEEEYASLNAQLAVPPQFDVVALADDLRLGMFVIAQLATRHGITVTLRPSPYGGTTAIVLLPHEIVVHEPAEPPDAEPTEGQATATRVLDGLTRAEATGGQAHGKAAGPARRDDAAGQEQTRTAANPALPTRRKGTPDGREHARPGETRRAGAAEPVTPAAQPGRRPGAGPLPRRVPQTSLAAELREEAVPAEEDAHDDEFTAERAASSLAGFQRGTLRARDEDGETPYEREDPAVDAPDLELSAALEQPVPPASPRRTDH